MSTPTARDSLIGVGSALLVLVLSNVFVASLAQLILGEMPELSRLTGPGLVAQGFAMVGWVLWLADRSSDGVVVSLAMRVPRRVWVVLGIIPAGLLADEVVQVLGRLLPVLDGGSMGLLEEALHEHPVLIGIGAVGMAPFYEELLFRGFAWRGFQRSWGSGAALAFTSVLFGLFHGDPLHAVGTLVIGLYLGLVRQWTGSIWACVLAHAMNNALWLVIGLWGDQLGL